MYYNLFHRTHCYLPSGFSQMVTTLMSIREVSGSNPGPVTDYSHFLIFLSPCRQMSRTNYATTAYLPHPYQVK